MFSRACYNQKTSNYSVAFRDYYHIAVKYDDHRLLQRFNINCPEDYNLCFRIFMAPRCDISKIYLDLYVTGATSYAIFHCSSLEITFIVLFYCLVARDYYVQKESP